MIARSMWRVVRTALEENEHEWTIAEAEFDDGRQHDTPAARGALEQAKQAWPSDSPGLADTVPRRENVLAD